MYNAGGDSEIKSSGLSWHRPHQLHRGGEAGEGRDAENAWVRQGIAQQTLHHRPGHAQGAPDERGFPNPLSAATIRDLATDTELLEWARHEAVYLLDHHPQLAQRHVQRWLGSRAHYLKA